MPHDLERYGSMYRYQDDEESIHQSRRHALFMLLVVACMSCVFFSYRVSSGSGTPCSTYIIWMPSCNREEYMTG
ncbi:hypothetical protein BCR42DRAFT_409005 [Absidia repens]|uniref:Uncharacterized protein n=1 Tax=Absidia repens TaxID=90262 RepID=A0A1X2IQH9_9FUNG|nr:hypothetical protein BCR42DRAFT_409005 [Absidia repens]